MRYSEIISEDAPKPDAMLDDLFEMANLPKQDTGIDGVISVSTAVASHAPRVKWYPGRPARRAPCLSVIISEIPQARNHRLPQLLADRMTPIVTEWVNLNRDALLQFWNEGETWTRQEVNAHLDALKKLPG